MSVSFFIQSVVAKIIGLFFACLISFSIFVQFVKGPIKFIKLNVLKLKKRNVMPPCLNDPSLGNHDFVHLEDIRLHYVASGDEGKPLMLFLHGFPEFWYSWRFQIREFRKDYRVVAVDMRGYGDSDKPKGKDNYTVQKLAGDIKQLIPALGYEKCFLVAHDWGGIVAWNFASNYPELVEKLVVCNCPHPAIFAKYMRSNFAQFKKSWYMMFFQIPVLPEFLLGMNDCSSFEALLGKWMPNNKPSSDDIDAYKYTFSPRESRTGPINYYRAALSNEVQYKKKISAPTLVIWGDPDKALDTEMAELSGEYVKNMKVKVIKNSSHFVITDRPKETNAAIRQFIEN
ncbi:epoxide hydrolase 4-like [Mya arenaria]|uniref:epoxide hydrolase 4-like n=1 Tax=Mya arenaria TaxID=6604 RepID=UPI0022E82EE1|nr:epoxide hydrolase 4-like [Mya arenaria]